MADEQIIEQSTETTPQPAETAPVAATEQVTPPDPQDRSAVLRAAMSEQKTRRGENGKFQPREQRGTWKPGQPAQTPPTPGLPGQLQRPEMPKSLKLELKQYWEQAPTELLAAIVERENKFNQGIEKYQGQAKSAEAILKQFEPYQWILQNENTTPEKAIAPLLQTAALLRTGTPQQKAAAVATMMSTFGIDLGHIQALMGGNPASAQQVFNPQYDQLQQQVQTLAQQLQEQRQREARIVEQRALSSVQAFAADPKNQHFEALQPRILALLENPAILGDITGKSEAEKLRIAYDTALRMDPVLSAQVAAQQQAQREVVTHAKKAAVQVVGAPGTAAKPAANLSDRRSVIANAMSALRN